MESLNPYESPRTTSNVDNRLRWNAGYVPRLLVATVTLIYCAFTGILLEAKSSDDNVAGRLFLLNFPVLAVWCYWVWRNSPWSYAVGFAVMVVQVGVTVAMFYLLKSGDVAAILGINGAFVLGFAVVTAALAWIGKPVRAVVFSD